MRESALFLDPDGVINVDRGHVFKAEQVEFIDGIFDLCREAKRRGYRVFVVTNQAGIGRGLFTEEQFLALTNWMSAIFREKDASIDKVYYCPFHPEHGIGAYKVDSPLRKPRPGMFLQADEEYGVDFGKSVSVGDQETDIQAGLAAGVAHNILYCPPTVPRPAHTAAGAIVSALPEIIPYLDGAIAAMEL